MKKTYVKPEVNEIEVSANQAVAACSVSKWCRCNGEYGQFYPTAKEAWDKNPGAHTYQHTDENGQGTSDRDWYEINYDKNGQPGGHYIFPVYMISGTHDDGSTWSFWFEDNNSNGVYDAGEQSNNYNGAITVGAGQSYSSVVVS